ncbi:cyclase family protein [Rhodohalobacter sp. SW132]|uniref:cyclase family protein n=1 Tax=Rhodohalobacter sp. SW132 TaxID=2293433 RepID=UPI000E259BE4|nr:cyclase family protein [Rhodohalobacter sp. SW132]REL29157.1 cyclase family protein [Rhodohalobacter sp. SW132]
MKFFLYSLPIILVILSGCSHGNSNDWSAGTWVDLTHDYSEETLFWPTSSTFHLDTVFVGETDAGFYYEAYEFCTAEHGGTHLDAPIHFAENRKTVDELELDQLTGYASVIDVTNEVEGDRDYQVQVSDIERWEEEHGELAEETILLFNTGMSRFWPDAEQYLGTSNRGEAALAELSFPGIHPDTARWLVENRTIKAVGLDTPSLDFGQSELFETHQVLFEENIPGFENVANLNLLPATGAYVVALPMKIRDGSGAPLRIAAHVMQE